MSTSLLQTAVEFFSSSVNGYRSWKLVMKKFSLELRFWYSGSAMIIKKNKKRRACAYFMQCKGKYSSSSVAFYRVQILNATFTYARSGCGAETGRFWHFRCATAVMSIHTRSGGRVDLPFLEDNDGLGRVVSKRTRKIWCWTHLLRIGFRSRSASAPRTRMCECKTWFVLKPIFRPPPSASAPRMCERNFTMVTGCACRPSSISRFS